MSTDEGTRPTINHETQKNQLMFRRNQGEKEQCTFCGKDGHNEDGCFKVIGYPHWWPGKDRQGKQRPRTVSVEGELWPTLGITEKVLEAKGGIVRQEQTPIVNMSGKFDKEVILHARYTFGDFDLGRAKFSRLPFPVSTTKTHACFDLIHCDIWGKYRTPSLTRASYFLTIVDDFSRATWVYLLKQKHEASMCLKAFHKMVQVQFEKNIRRIRCDNGGEFISNQMIEFYANQGIILETSCIHTPQQNGVVERKHRHLLETARALRFEANLPTRFWGECVLTAAYVINRMPSDVIGNKTPYEVLYNQKPNYDNMRVFGCLAYYKSTETNGDKFKMKGRPGVFLGYPPGTKGYKIFDIIHNKIVISRDVRFIENFFPFANIKVEEEEIFIPPSIWDDEVIEEKPKDLIGEPNETEIGHSEPIEEFEDDFEHHTQTEAPSEDQTEVDVGPEGSQDEDNQFGPTEEPTFNSDSNNFVEP
ncbi:putative RNA-directed DNA polymerase [Tanacetum coccineum]|uniref:RNA-directed DNA polymerase n=1 Tax=Tanacetum coccineum TaxID=301880 RepID=A0ABQ5GB06_9ASTR